MPEATSSRSVWNGAITFGLVTIPVRLHIATSEKTVSFNQLDVRDGSRIKYKRVNAVTGEEVPRDLIGRGYEVGKDSYVLIEDEELEAVRGESSRAIDILEFVPQDQIDPLYYKSGYYLAPEETGLKAYRVLLRALQDTDRVGIAKFSLRAKEYLATVRAQEDVLVLGMMYWPDEIREPRFAALERSTEIRDAELDMAKMLIEGMTAGFDPDEYHDTTREAVEELVRRKVDGEEIVVLAAAPQAQVTDLMAALLASVEATRARRAAGGEGDQAEEAEVVPVAPKGSTGREPVADDAARPRTRRRAAS